MSSQYCDSIQPQPSEDFLPFTVCFYYSMLFKKKKEKYFKMFHVKQKIEHVSCETFLKKYILRKMGITVDFKRFTYYNKKTV